MEEPALGGDVQGGRILLLQPGCRRLPADAVGSSLAVCAPPLCLLRWKGGGASALAWQSLSSACNTWSPEALPRTTRASSRWVRI